jgi:hypothetical protein
MLHSFSTRVTCAPDVIFQAVGDEAVLLNMKTTLYLGLNPMGARMWTTITGANSIQAAFDSLLTEFDVPEDRLRQDLEEFLAKLNEYALIAISPDAPAAPKAPVKS